MQLPYYHMRLPHYHMRLPHYHMRLSYYYMRLPYYLMQLPLWLQLTLTVFPGLMIVYSTNIYGLLLAGCLNFPTLQSFLSSFQKKGIVYIFQSNGGIGLNCN